jgi:cyclopropane-fatty-acyl-phospholipid synthase
MRIGITLKTPDGFSHDLTQDNAVSEIKISVNNWTFFWDLLIGYDLGFAESYLNGKWDCRDLPGLFRHLSKSRSDNLFSRLLNYSPNKFRARISQRIKSSNTLVWASRNVREHYDLSNEFFSLFLDPSMTYSSAVYKSDDQNLEEAQISKLDILLSRGQLKPSDHILDIGCGWGSLALRAAKEYNCKVTGLTLSKNQYSYVRELVDRSQLAGKIKVKLLDYRKLEGVFNHIYAVEMLEAVGHVGIDQFFLKCSKLLADNGSLQIQVITVPDNRYESYRNNCDFIQKHIFPGGMLPSLEIIEKSAKKNGFELMHSNSLRKHYEQTLRTWRSNLLERWDKNQVSGFGLRDYRKFYYYFSYCEGAFASQHIDNYQLSFKKH